MGREASREWVRVLKGNAKGALEGASEGVWRGVAREQPSSV